MLHLNKSYEAFQSFDLLCISRYTQISLRWGLGGKSITSRAVLLIYSFHSSSGSSSRDQGSDIGKNKAREWIRGQGNGNATNAPHKGGTGPWRPI